MVAVVAPGLAVVRPTGRRLVAQAPPFLAALTALLPPGVVVFVAVVSPLLLLARPVVAIGGGGDPCAQNNCNGHGDCNPTDGTCTCVTGWGGGTCGACDHPCTAGPPATNAAWRSGTCSGQPHCLDDSCYAVCSPGYDASGSTSYTCSSSGEWDGDNGGLTCTPKTCAKGPPSGVAHATSCPEGQYGGATCTAGCEDGYEPAQGHSNTQYRCGEDGTWGGGDLQCVGKLCRGAPEAKGELQLKVRGMQ